MTAMRWLLVAVVLTLSAQEGHSQSDTIFTSGDSVGVVQLPDIQSLLHDLASRRSHLRLDSLFLYRVIEHDELMNFYHEDFADFLWHVGGLYVHDLGSYGKPITVSANGSSNRNIVFLLDGFVLNESDVGWLNLNQLSIENIERLEVYRGPAAGQYAASGASGYVNIVPRSFRADEPVTSLKYRSIFSDFGDIGVYFGRNFGSRFRAYVGGSSKETPGQQYIQGLRGGLIVNLQETRYDGKQMFGGFDYLVNEEWLLRFHTQSSKDRFDAYGRNLFGDRKAFEFATVGGRRTDERSDYHLSLIRTGDTDLWETRLSMITLDRTSKNFQQTEMPVFYRSRTKRGESVYSREWLSHRLESGLSYETHELSPLDTGSRTLDRLALHVADVFPMGPVYLKPAFRLDFYSNDRRTKAADFAVVFPLEDWKFTAAAGTSERILLPLEDYLYRYSLSSQPALSSNKERLIHVSATGEAATVLLDRVAVTYYRNVWKDGFYYEPSGYFSDTTRLFLRQKDGSTHGLDVELTQSLFTIQWTLRQTFFTGDAELRSGLPPYRTWVSGYTERMFFNKNLRITAFLSASYLSRHDGFTFDDAPQRYYPAPRRSDGGWILNTRISGHIGDFQFFYEAGNFPRARFTMLDGYDITPQQVRVGLIWILYN